jgi:hypothetical protein
MSSKTRKNINTTSGPQYISLNRIMKILQFSAEYTVRSDNTAISIAEGVCDMINLFTIEELRKIQKNNKQFFNIIKSLFYAIGESSSKSSVIFKEVCKNKLGKEKNTLINSNQNESTMNSKLLQEGGSFGTITIIMMIFWLIVSTDLLANPETAITLSIMVKLMQSYSGLSGMHDFMKSLFGAEIDIKYPAVYAEGPVLPLLGNEGVSGKAYIRLHTLTEELEKDIDLAEEVAAENNVEAETGMANLMSCARTGTCSLVSDQIIGESLQPLADSDAARPRLSAAQVKNQAHLKSLQSELKKEEGRWFMNKDPEKIIKLTENIRTLVAEIDATNIKQGLVNTLPSLSNSGQIASVIEFVSKNVLNQVKDPNLDTPNSIRLGIKPSSALSLYNENENAKGNKGLVASKGVSQYKSTVAEYKKPGVVTSEALVAAGINKIMVNISKIAKQHPGAELDMITVNAFGSAYKLLFDAQKTVGSSTKIDVSKINKLVDTLFKKNDKMENEEGGKMLTFFGFNKDVSKKSEGRSLLTALVTKAAAKQALENGMRKQDILNVEISRVLDHNIQSVIHGMIQALTNKLMSLGFKGSREDAEKAAINAIDISRMFGVKPNLETNDYALSVIACTTGGTCPKKSFTELRDRGELLREMKTWGFLRRFQHAKWNIFFSLLLMLPTGIIADSLLLTVVGVGGFLGRWTMWGVKGQEQKEELTLKEAVAAHRRRQAILNAEHERELARIRNPPVIPNAAAAAAPLMLPAPVAAAGVGPLAPQALQQNAPPAGVAAAAAGQPQAAINQELQRLQANINTKEARVTEIRTSMQGKTDQEQAEIRPQLRAAKEILRLARVAHANAESRRGGRRTRKYRK